jgi:NAD(P)-dependent dehydrogenase (short-subunit alcohol dehydrogenase family)
VPGIIDAPMQDEVLTKVALYRGLPREEISRVRNSTIPLGRPGTPADAAAVAWLLLSDESRYMTGQAVNCTGGQIMW